MLIGDMLLACAAVTYAGGMPDAARSKLATAWHAECKRLQIPTSDTFSVVTALTQHSEVRDARALAPGAAGLIRVWGLGLLFVSQSQLAQA